MAHSIKFPEKRTYWIAYKDASTFVYNWVEKDQELVTGQDNLFKTEDMNEWIVELRSGFNTPYPDLPDNQIWGYKYTSKELAEADLEKLSDYEDVTVEEISADSIWYIKYQKDMVKVLGEPVIISLPQEEEK